MHKAGKEVVRDVLDAYVKARYPIYQLTPWKIKFSSRAHAGNWQPI